MHPKYKYAHSAFLALSGSHSVATGTDGAVGEGVSAAIASHHGRRPKLGSANPLGSECVPTTPEPNWDDIVLPLPRKKNTIKADIGILTPESKPCPGLYDLCEVDETSLLGGRCTASSRRMEISEQEKLQECAAKCPGNKLCDCYYGQASDDECTYSIITSACRNKEFSRCLTMSEDDLTNWEVFYCPFYSCLDGIDEEKNNVDAYDVCMTCVAYKNLCDYCKENNGSFSGCADEDTYNLCKNAPINKTYHYSQNCTDSLESLGGRFSWDGNDDSKGDDNGDKDDGSGVGKLSDNGNTIDPVDDDNGEGASVNKSDASSFVGTDDNDDGKGDDNGDKDDGSGVGKLSDNGDTTDPLDVGNGEGTDVNKSDASSFVGTQEDNSSSGGKAVVGIAVATLAMVSVGIFNS